MLVIHFRLDGWLSYGCRHWFMHMVSGCHMTRLFYAPGHDASSCLLCLEMFSDVSEQQSPLLAVESVLLTESHLSVQPLLVRW